MSGENGRVAVRSEMRWNGWGDPARASDLPRAVRMLLPLLLGRPQKPVTAVNLAEVRVEPSALLDGDLEALRAVVGAEHILSLIHI